MFYLKNMHRIFRPGIDLQAELHVSGSLLVYNKMVPVLLTFYSRLSSGNEAQLVLI